MNEEERDALLAQLASPHAPQVSWVPAIGWWLVLLGLLLLAFALYRWYRYRQARLWQKEALGELQRLRLGLSQQPVTHTLSGTSRLVRQVAIVASGREEVAALNGNAWLQRLDELCEKPLFSSGFGRLLETGPYQRAPTINHGDLNALLDAVEELIRAVSRRQPGSTA